MKIPQSPYGRARHPIRTLTAPHTYVEIAHTYLRQPCVLVREKTKSRNSYILTYEK